MIVYDGYASNYTRNSGNSSVIKLARRVAGALKIMQEQLHFDAVVVHGNSGVSIGFAALVMHDFNLVLLRKDNDNSHGSPIEGPNGLNMQSYIILDDFIGTGATVRRIISKIDQLAAQKGSKAVCAGVLQYKPSEETSVLFGDPYVVDPARVRAYSAECILSGTSAFPVGWRTCPTTERNSL